MQKVTRFLSALRTTLLGASVLLGLWQDYRMQKAIRETATLQARRLPRPAPRVSIILPVRNEQENIDDCLASLLAQDYPDFEVIVIDDGSTDDTPARLAEWQQREARLRVHRIEELPAGWAGKAHALHTGATLASGEWLLFTDADTRHAPQTLRLMVAHAIAHRLDLLSMFTEMQILGLAARLLTPMTGLLLTVLVTPGEIRSAARPRQAFAFGQYILVRREAYEATGGFSAPEVRASFTEDMGIAQVLKRQGWREDIVGGCGLVKNVQWTTWRSAWRGLRKGAYGKLAPYPLLGFAGGCFLVYYGLAPLLTLRAALRPGHLRQERLSALLALLALCLQVDSKRRFGQAFGLPARWALLAPVASTAFGFLLLDTMRLAINGQGADWKGRRAPRLTRTNMLPLL
ncbi:glycosyltransferase [Thermogemmatispora onikobensis]|uniref:glycosyltransferase n=1 Tax=Thermogemmatispora onikobensis TaxID=732234 RepID=UPI00085310DE|nr:glycosyltransferase family 2 protein [Thermogemmatispora onikobensis]